MIHFFEIQRPGSSGFAKIGEAGMKYPTACPTCTRTGWRISPLSITFNDNKLLGDFTWLAPDVFVSQNAVNILNKFKSPSFDFDSIKIIGKRLETVFHLNVEARCLIAPECGVQIISECATCGHQVFSTWIDGLKVNSDLCGYNIFRLSEHPGRIFVSERVMDEITKSNLTNIEFIPMENIKDSIAWMRPRK